MATIKKVILAMAIVCFLVTPALAWQTAETNGGTMLDYYDSGVGHYSGIVSDNTYDAYGQGTFFAYADGASNAGGNADGSGFQLPGFSVSFSKSTLESSARSDSGGIFGGTDTALAITSGTAFQGTDGVAGSNQASSVGVEYTDASYLALSTDAGLSHCGAGADGDGMTSGSTSTTARTSPDGQSSSTLASTSGRGVANGHGDLVSVNVRGAGIVEQNQFAENSNAIARNSGVGTYDFDNDTGQDHISGAGRSFRGAIVRLY